MDIDKLILGFAKENVGEILISDEMGNILYRNHCLDFREADWQRWLDHNLDGEDITESMEWEITDKEKEKSSECILLRLRTGMSTM